MFTRVVLALLCAYFAACSLRAQNDSASVLAQILADKGALSAAELARVRVADEHGKLAVLASILQDKGVLSSSDLARLSLPAATTAPAPAVAPVEAATTPAPTPEVKNSNLAVTTKKHLPVSLYGTLLFNAGYNTADFNFEDTPVIANKQGSDPIGGDKNFYATGRQTRIGLNLDPIAMGSGKLSGQFEFDLFGGEPPLANGVNMDLFRLRTAFGRVDWDNVAVEAGQDWSIFAPLNPTSLTQFALPELSSTGNLWIRIPQLRVELKKNAANGNRFLMQLAASDPDMGDYSTTVISDSRQPGIGERGRMPGLESRLAWTKSHADRDYTVGLSGHYGRGKNAGTVGNGTVNVQSPVDSWGIALDYSLPFTKYFNLTGEAYEGRALGIYSSASGESIGAVGTVGAHGVESRGGWIQAQFNFNKQWQTNLAYGIDAANAAELPVGSRSRNQSYIGNVIYKVNLNIALSLEYRRILTDYRNQLTANERGDHVDLGIAYSF
jgi:hypothetical protein